MKLQMKGIVLVTLFLSSFGLLNEAYGQCDGWNWPEDKATAEEKNALYGDALKQKDYTGAADQLRWLLQNAPNLNTSIYIKGVKIYEGLADQETDKAQKLAYIDTVMQLYDKRIEICGNKVDVLNRKAFSAYKYYIKDPSKYEELLALFDEVFEISGDDVDRNNLRAYMNVLKVNKLGKKNLTDEQVLEKYDKLSEIVDKRIKAGKNVASYQKTKDFADKILVEIVTVDCNFVKENMGPKFEASPTDIKLAKRIFSFMLAGKCTDEPLWFQAGEVIFNDQPDFGLAKNLALKCKSNDDKECAKMYFDKAIELASNDSDKADMYVQLGTLATSKAQARNSYTKALQLDPNKKEAYTYIGQLYYGSFNNCTAGKDIVVDRSVFLVAYDMFKKAGNSRMMKAAKEQFPSKEEIFTFNYQSGQSIDVGCWINTTTTVRSRD